MSGIDLYILLRSKISVKPDYFKILTEDQITAAHNVLSAPPVPFPATRSAPAVREFNLDIAKLLLQFASIVYERKSQAIYKTVDHSKKEAKKTGRFSWFSTPSLLSTPFKDALSGNEFRDRIVKRLEKAGLNEDRWGTKVITDFCALVKVGYAPVSELQTSESVSFFKN